MLKVSKSQLKSKMLEYFRRIESTGEEIIVTNFGEPVIKIIPISKKSLPSEIFSEYRGKVEYFEDILTDTSDEWPENSRVLLDTHALLWWTLDPAMLSDTAKEICGEIPKTGGFVSSISLWEIGIKIRNGKLDIGMDIRRYTEKLSQMNLIEIIPVSADIWIKNLELNWSSRDPADRTIVATAMILEVPVLSKDVRIREFYPETIW